MVGTSSEGVSIGEVGDGRRVGVAAGAGVVEDEAGIVGADGCAGGVGEAVGCAQLASQANVNRKVRE